MSKNNQNDHIHEDVDFDEEIFASIFRKGAHEYLKGDLLSEYPKIPKEDIPPLDDECKQGIQKMINKHNRKQRRKRFVKHLPRIAAVFLVFVLVSGITVMSVEAIRVPFLNLFVQTEEIATTIDVGEEGVIVEEQSFASMIEYIPEGYELVAEETIDSGTQLEYSNGGYPLIIDITSGGSTFSVDTEGGEFGEMLIFEDEGFYTSKNGITTLVFTKNGYAYMLAGALELSEIVKIAENIK